MNLIARCCLPFSLFLILLSAPSLFEDEVFAQDVDTLEAGDPGYRSCKDEDFLKRCFRRKLKAGESIKLNASDFGFTGTQLMVYERHHPFKAKVNKTDFTITVPEDYLWAEVRLETTSGARMMILLYDDLRLARAALAKFEREVNKKRGSAAPRAFFAEVKEVTGDALKEVIIYGGSGYEHKGKTRTEFGLITSWDGKRKLTTTKQSYPHLNIRKVDIKDGRPPFNLIAEGYTGCEEPSNFKLWRFNDAGKVGTFFNVKKMKGLYGVPDKVAKKKKLWLTPVLSGELITGLNVFTSKEGCLSGSGYHLFWRNSALRGRKL